MANAEEYAAKIWSCNNRALWFLIWVGLLSLPKYCNRGHEWKFSRNKDGSYIHLHCTAKLDAVFPLEDEDDEEADLKAPVHKRCNYKKSWRDHGFLTARLPPSFVLVLLRCPAEADFERDWPQNQDLETNPLTCQRPLVVGASGTCWPCSPGWSRTCGYHR